jgi:phage terminase large subunit-like protein
VEAKATECGIRFDWWQKQIGRLVLGKRADGLYAATIGGVVWSIPRQVGKTFLVGTMLVMMCLLFPGLTVLWTAHHTRTATKTFGSLQRLVKRKKIGLTDDDIRKANGEQEIRFRNGSIIMFGARDAGFGLGFDQVDVVVFDEAQRLTEKALDDMIAPTNQAQHPHGALVFYIGTPPRPTDPSEAFTNRRKAALDGEDDMVYLEFGADPGSDPDDQKQWAKANPSFPSRTPLHSMLRLRRQLVSVDSWKREGMGMWDEFEKTKQVISGGSWSRLVIPDEEVPLDAPARYALAMSPERVAAIAIAIPGELAAFVDLAEFERVTDTRKIVDWLVERCGRRIPVMIDARDPAAALVGPLRARKVKVNVTTQSDGVRAFTALLSAVDEKTVHHVDQPAIKTALRVAKKKPIGKSTRCEWDVDDPTAEVAALRALTLAHYGLSFMKKRSTSKQRVVVLS